MAVLEAYMGADMISSMPSANAQIGREIKAMSFFVVTFIYFLLALGCRLFAGYDGPILGSGWISYLLLISILYAIARLIFGLRTWRTKDEAESH
jgi:hypothetical protein